MKLVRFSAHTLITNETDAYFRLGLWEDKTIFDLTESNPEVFGSITQFLQQDDPVAVINEAKSRARPIHIDLTEIQAPLDFQEVWAASVTYDRDCDARVSRTGNANTGATLQGAYQAKRPVLFFKATPDRVVGHNREVHMRKDSQWSVPEPSLALVISPSARLVGFSIGNDISSRDIEDENPFFQPQARIYRQSCAIGPAILIADTVTDPGALAIQLSILRDKNLVFEGKTTVSEMRRSFDELIEYLTRENDFLNGVYLLTGNGIVLPDSLSLQPGDRIEVTIPEIGTLSNTVAVE